MKVSFLLPTKTSDRNYEEFAAKVIESINENCSHEKEILVFGPNEIKGENIKWFEEEDWCPSGCIYGYNYLFEQSSGEFVFVANDEYMFQNRAPDMAIEILESSYYKDKKFKILGMASPIRSFPNEHMTNGYTCVPNFDLVERNFRICGYPAFHRQTIEECLDGFIFHPRIKHHYGDNFLPFYAGFMGEPINDCPASDFKLVRDKDLTYYEYDNHDFEIYSGLVSDLVSGKTTRYVEERP